MKKFLVLYYTEKARLHSALRFLPYIAYVIVFKQVKLV